MTDTIDREDYEETPQPEGVDAPVAKQRTFNGIDLQPFNGRRVMAAQRLGFRLFTLSKEEISSAAEGDPYAGFLFDATVTLYLCSQPIPESYRAMRKPAQVIEAAMEWGERNDICPGKPQFAEAMTVFDDILVELQGSETKQDPARDGKAKRQKKSDRR